jgi:hypothetical protein
MTAIEAVNGRVPAAAKMGEQVQHRNEAQTAMARINKDVHHCATCV